MSREVRSIARALRSASLNYLPSGDLALLDFSDRRLIEKIYDGEDLKDKRMVASGLREGSTAAYVTPKDRTFAVYINDDSIIKASEYDEDSEEWDEAELEGLGDISAHYEGHITVAAVPSMNLVLYQAPDSDIKTIKHHKDSNTWTEEFSIPAEAKFGTPIAGFSTDEALVVCFFADDNKIHAHSRNFGTGEWTEEVIPGSSFDETVDRIIVGKDKDSGNFEAFVLSNNTVYNVTKTGSCDTVGQFDQAGEFKPSSDAEDGVYSNNWGNYHLGYSCCRGCECGCGQGSPCGCNTCGCGCPRPSQTPQW